GITYSDLKKIPASDLFDTNHVGLSTAAYCLKELAKGFSEIEKNGPLSILINEIEDIQWNDPIDSAESIEELQDAIIYHFNDYLQVDNRVRAILYSRHPALIRNSRTLDDLGQEFGVTRERIRQIEAKFQDLEIGVLKTENKLLLKAIDVLSESSSFEEFTELMRENDLADYEYMSDGILESIAKVLGLLDYIERIEKESSRIRANYTNKRIVSNKMREFRNKIGLIDVDLVMKNLNLTKNEFEKAVAVQYPRSLVHGSICLARTSSLDSAFENCIYKQLFVAPNIDAEEILIGVKRHAAYRGCNTLVNDKDIVGLIHLLADNPPSIETLLEKMRQPAQLAESDKWIIKIFTASNTEILHRNEVVKAAINDGFDFTSAQVYLSTSMLIRPVDTGLFRLIGTDVSASQVKIANRIAKDSIDEIEITSEFIGENLVLRIIPNTNSLSGVIFPTKAIKEMLRNIEFLPNCTCGELFTNQRVKVTESNFLMGFNAIFKHGINEHSLLIGDEFEIEFNFKMNSCTLNV
ncbi:MAG: sigma factor-like helix-turn-helix DNA-binding protein, partial [Pseudomonadota bacterium]